MPIGVRLVTLAHELRHARTGLLPMEIAEQVQHTIVRIEHILASPVLDAAAAQAIEANAQKLLDECAALLKRQSQ